MVGSLLLVLVLVASGTGLTYALGVRLRPEERIAVGVVFGAVLFCGLSFAVFVLAGMGWPAVVVGAVVPLAGAAAAVRRAWPHVCRDAAAVVRRLRLPSRKAASLRPLALATAAAAAVATRILSLAYQTTAEGISVGNLAVYGDWSAHLAYAGSFAYGDNRGLELPLAAGAPLKYHFLANYFGSTFTVTGATLQQGLVVSAWLLAVAFTPLLWCAAQRLTGSRAAAGLTVALFCLSGGVGAWFWVQDVRGQGWAAVTTVPTTYARMPDRGIWLDNQISASLYAQRSTLMGLCMALAALVLLLAARRARPAGRRGGFVVAGLLVGACGIVFVHALFTGLALGVLALVCERRREWWWFLGSAAVVGLPLAAAIAPPTSEMRWLVGWMAAEEGQAWPWFWLRNAGLFLPLFAAVAVFGGAPARLQRLSRPLWLWFVAANLVSFHPWSGNNAKFLLFWQLAGCVVLAATARHAWTVRPRLLARGLVVVAVGALVATGAVDTLRATQRSTAIPWVDAAEGELAGWLRHHAQRGDVLVYGATNTSAVAALAGVPAVSAYPGWTDDLGLADWRDRELASQEILRGGPRAEALMAAYGVTWVLIGPAERAFMDASVTYWDTHGTLAATRGEYRLYRVPEALRSSPE